MATSPSTNPERTAPMFKDLTTGDTFTPAIGMSVVYCGTGCPQLTNGTVPGDDAYDLADLSSLCVGEFYGVFDHAQPEPTWWLTEVVK